MSEQVPVYGLLIWASDLGSTFNDKMVTNYGAGDMYPESTVNTKLLCSVPMDTNKFVGLGRRYKRKPTRIVRDLEAKCTDSYVI